MRLGQASAEVPLATSLTAVREASEQTEYGVTGTFHQLLIDGCGSAPGAIGNACHDEGRDDARHESDCPAEESKEDHSQQ
jgi:hypothetical protein